MKLIGVLLALAAERALGHLPGVGEPLVFRRCLLTLRRVLHWPVIWRNWGTPLLILLPAIGVVAGAQLNLHSVIASLFFSTVVLFLCLGPRDLSDDIARLLQARKAGDEAAVKQLTQALMLGGAPESTREDLIGALFIQSHERLFGVLFWFLAAGPAGAVAYRLASRLPRLLHEMEPGAVSVQAAAGLHAALAFIPARLTALLYGMAGSMDSAMREWRRLREAGGDNWRHNWIGRTWAVLAEVSAGSLVVDAPQAGAATPASLDDCLREVQALQTRALLILLAAFAFFTAGELV